MRFGTIFALLFSVVIIGLALWWRFSEVKPSTEGIYSVANERPDDYEATLEFFTTPKEELSTTTEPTEPKPLTQTDIVTRNMLLSYMGTVIGNTEVQTKDMEQIAGVYIEEATKLHTFKRMVAADIKMVADSDANARFYAEGFAKTYDSFANRMNLMLTSIGAKAQEENAYISFVGPVANMYTEMANSLRALPVPVSLSLLHLELINIYLSNAAAMRAAEKLTDEPMVAMSGLVAIKDNSTRETKILEEMISVFTSKWGVIE